MRPRPAPGGDDPEALRRVVLEAARAVGEEGWAAGFCAEMAGHGDFRVRGNAFYGLARLAERRVALDRGRIQPIIEAGMADPEVYVSGHAKVAAESVEGKLRWVIAAFDNGNPEMEVAAHANGWVQCPCCLLRFSTRDPGGFREGRCMRCRQKLRVIGGDA